MNYQEWERCVPGDIAGDVLWKVQVYRLALFLSDLSWTDVTKLVRDRRTIALSDQLYRSVGSVGANIAEGYSRGSGKDRARFYKYALGSAREGRDWYYKGRYVLGEVVAAHRIHLLTQIIKLLLKMIPDQRHVMLKEESTFYSIIQSEMLTDVPLPD